MEDYQGPGTPNPQVGQVTTPDSVSVSFHVFVLEAPLIQPQTSAVLSYRICPCRCQKSRWEGSVYAAMMGCWATMCELLMNKPKLECMEAWEKMHIYCQCSLILDSRCDPTHNAENATQRWLISRRDVSDPGQNFCGWAAASRIELSGDQVISLLESWMATGCKC